MKPSHIAAFMIVLVAVTSSCGKDGGVSPRADQFYGTWVNATINGDTLRFSRKGGKNILSYRLTAGQPQLTEVEFKYTSGKLFIRGFIGPSNEYFPLTNFKWNIVGKEFEWNGNQRFPYLSSIQPNYVYRKLP